MKRFTAIAAIAVGSLLLIGCESRLDRNTHLCGLNAANQISLEELNPQLCVRENGLFYCRSITGIHLIAKKFDTVN